MRTLAIDLGSKRVGLALSDAGGTLASPYEVLAVNNAAQATAPILRIVEREGVERIVLGLPLNMDDSFSAQTRGVVAWGARLAAAVDMPVIYVDERLSSFAAEQQLISLKRAGQKMTRKDKKRSLDAVAAAEFLQAFLDGRLLGLDISNP
ncbi:MAG TPA: Holliday junction resolvase RuvX [Tepidisphaeraceae bacterium]|jgi:putative Holliday junction resolvase